MRLSLLMSDHQRVRASFARASCSRNTFIHASTCLDSGVYEKSFCFHRTHRRRTTVSMPPVGTTRGGRSIPRQVCPLSCHFLLQRNRLRESMQRTGHTYESYRISVTQCCAHHLCHLDLGTCVPFKTSWIFHRSSCSRVPAQTFVPLWLRGTKTTCEVFKKLFGD